MSDAQQPTEPDPNAPWSPEEGIEEMTVEQVQDIAASLPLLKEVIEWFDEQIADFLNPNVIQGATAASKAEDIKQQVLFAQKMSKGYSKKRNQFAVRFKKYVDITKPQE